MREITDVIRRMRAALPAYETALQAKLERLGKDCCFTPPEMMAARWRELCMIFNSDIFDSADPEMWDRAKAPAWAEQAGKILAGED